MKLTLPSRRAAYATTSVDASYRRTTNRIGAVLVLFVILFDSIGLFFLPMDGLFEIFLPENAADAAVDLLDSMEYLLSFLLPGVLFYLITPRRERVPMQLSPRMPRGTVWLIFIGMTVITMTAIINNWMVSLFEYGKFSSEVLWDTSTLMDYEGVLLFISTAIVPAFCEEFLFRGVICNSLRPYGKTIAVIGSAVLFGLMHQNVGQLFYTTVAGLVLALIYVETRSIWAPILLHLFNNLSSVVYDIVSDRLDRVSANRLLALIDAVVIGLGLVSLMVLIVKAERAASRGERALLLGGGWQEDAACGLPSPSRRLRDFFSPMMLLFWVLAIGQMIQLLSYAIRYAYG